jgi:hypothetical protein
MANGGSCHQFRQKVAFAGPAWKKSRRVLLPRPAVCRQSPAVLSVQPHWPVWTRGIQGRKSIAYT